MEYKQAFDGKGTVMATAGMWTERADANEGAGETNVGGRPTIKDRQRVERE